MSVRRNQQLAECAGLSARCLPHPRPRKSDSGVAWPRPAARKLGGMSASCSVDVKSEFPARAASRRRHGPCFDSKDRMLHDCFVTVNDRLICEAKREANRSRNAGGSVERTTERIPVWVDVAECDPQ